MKKLFLNVFTLILLMSFSHINASENYYDDGKSEVKIDSHSIKVNKNGEISDFVKANCSANIGNVTVFMSVNCFLCGQERADRKCERKLNELLENARVGRPDCNCN
ncbi:hypothetical protein SAMN05444278_102150 [Psychroflexus salarius]|uniref:Uncharacterized protein n=1 Tax=Psychroflexus salarius TaxID=1155689 RepID=A0A1M4U1Z6_9FLAO|nr:hypothetical protein [Psychroflexus salarius]SHE50831.1 hypothetical protein SAMN05444278_102150 [Psychroflexus salarius]